MIFNVVLTNEAEDDLEKLRSSGQKAEIRKIEKLLVELATHPRSGSGQIEPLKGSLSGFWSRRISKANRLIYFIDDQTGTVNVIACLGHYK
jgi:toxin YoeB